jgi:hypothetical protein
MVVDWALLDQEVLISGSLVVVEEEQEDLVLLILEVQVALVEVELENQNQITMFLFQQLQQFKVLEVEVEVLLFKQIDQLVMVVPVSSSSHTHHKTSRTLLKLSHTPPQGPTRHCIISR